jgi:hypothetical protein
MIRQDRWSSLKNISIWFVTFCFCALFIWLALQSPQPTLAQVTSSPTPTPNCSPTPTPTPIQVALPTCTPCASATPPQSWHDPWVEIPEEYQPTDGARLAWIVHLPPGSLPAPAVLVIHGMQEARRTLGTLLTILLLLATTLSQSSMSLPVVAIL